MLSKLKEEIVFFDIETSGLPIDWRKPYTVLSNWPYVVQLAWMKSTFEKSNILEFKDVILKPENFKISTDSELVHGISQKQAESEGWDRKMILESFAKSVLDCRIIVAHNSDFDINVIRCEFLRNNIPDPFEDKIVICTMKSSTEYCALSNQYGNYKWPSLNELHIKLFGVDFNNSHNAKYDLKATFDCFWKLLELSIINLPNNLGISNDDSTCTVLGVKEFLSKGDYFIRFISSFHPLSEALIEKYADLWSWGTSGNYVLLKGLSGNEHLPWSFEFINKYIIKWNWYLVSSNRSLPSIIDCELQVNNKNDYLERFSKNINWYTIGKRNDLNWSLDLVCIFSKYSHVSYLSSNTSIQWSSELISNYIAEWDWKELSANESLPLSISFINSFKDNWDWDIFSKNKSIPLSLCLIKYFYSYWNWKSLSSNKNIHWSFSIISFFTNELDWELLSENESLPWSFSLIKKYVKNWNLYNFGKIRTINWNIELIEFLLKNGDTSNKNHPIYGSLNMGRGFFYSLSRNSAVCWNFSLLQKYEGQLQWNDLSRSKSLTWSEELIDRFIRKWKWDVLSGNEFLPWSVDFFEKYIEYWNWNVLSSNPSLPWSLDFIKKHIDRWDWDGSEDGGCVYSCGINLNSGIRYDFVLIKEFEDYWNWEYLSKEYMEFLYGGYVRKDIDWSIDLLLQFAHKWNWNELQNSETIYNLLFSKIHEDDLEELIVYYKNNNNQ
ncbi:MAG: 3'-5' exonuclease [Algoriphagus sp.]|uniref:3'-5' exonuclease n=1 Tax=Algoriphagus sp. TaxID=1872435 RepID=UPI002736891E|nr:3'-5' exonuclease [Algoriphagus sp.]MDP3471758.1 3'-5' exonuclease [Algoriphagus sp.]